MLLQHHAMPLLICFAVWSTTLSTEKNVVAFAFRHPICKAHPRPRHLSSIPKRTALLLSADDNSARSIVTTEFDREDKASSSSLTILEESFSPSSSVENTKDAVPANVQDEPITDRKNRDATRNLWEKRLVTSEDKFSVHKVSAVVYTLSSFTLMGTAAARWLVGRQELFATVPDYLEPVMWAFCISNFFMCAASIRMAWIFRRNNVASRNAFVGVAGSSLFSAYFLVWASPFAPELMITPLASRIGFGILCGWNIILIGDTMIRSKDIIDDRRDDRAQDENAPFALEYLRYIASAAWPLPVIASTGYISSVLHDHEYMISVFDQVLKTDGLGMQASVFYNNVGGSMAAAYGAFFITLRDKKLISKQEEWMGIAAFSVPVLIWTADVSARFIPYVLGIASLDQ
mmetsp:Transcript_25444/g.40022  ORF Transcript_25444/g.40022 Transcript_25444/m.40022 type:complete len:403 (+) Transcript_25444:175-1383(+)